MSDPDRLRRDRAREAVREWLRAPDSDGFARVGRSEIQAAADAAARLGRVENDDEPSRILAEIEALAAGLAARPEPRRWWQLGAPEAPKPANADQIAALAGRLDAQRDAIKRRLIMLHGDRDRFTAADRGLAEADALVAAVEQAIEAAMREIRAQDADRAATLEQQAAAALAERRQAILTQATLTTQAMLTIDLLIANQQALATALDHARTATLAALQIATAARAATAAGSDAAAARDRLTAAGAELRGVLRR